MGGKRLYTVSALLGLGTLAGCAAEDQQQARGPKVINGDWGDPDKYPEIGGAYASLTAMNGTCTFDAKAGAVTIALDTSAQTVVVGKRAVDSLLVINGVADCTDSVDATKTVTVATKSIKSVAITAATASSDQNVVLDFLAGTFGAGAKSKAGITIKLDGDGSNGDVVAIRGTSGKDAFAAGATGVAAGAAGFAINNDSYADIDLVGVEKLSVSLAAGDDVFTGGGGSGTGNPYTGPLTVFGGADKDTLTGGNGADSVNGGDGDDTLTGGAGADALNGDLGDDTITQGADPDGNDVIICGGGTKDKVSYALRGDLTNGATEKVTVTVGTPYDSSGATPVPQPNDGDSAAGETDDVDTTCEILVGSMGNDTLMGDDSKADVIYGGPGNDTLSGGGGADTLYGEDGNDTFDETLYDDEDADGLPYEVAASQASTGADTFVGGAGTDTVDYSARTGNVIAVMDGDIKTIATVTAGTAPANDGEGSENDNIVNDVENIYGGEGNDQLTGNALNNTLRGGPGNDTLSGLAGDDTFDEKVGWDTSSPPAVADATLDSGNDTMIGGLGVDTVDYSQRNAPLFISMTGNAGTPDADDGADTDADGTVDELDDVYDDVENVLGGLLADDILGNAGNNDIKGGAGADTLAGGAGNDTIDGGGGDDTIDGGTGDDTIDGGTGQSAAFLTCGAGDDIAFNGSVDTTIPDLSCEILL
jgi:Ca2+-binding RTX toxin-like protein